MKKEVNTFDLTRQLVNSLLEQRSEQIGRYAYVAGYLETMVAQMAAMSPECREYLESKFIYRE